MVSQFCRNMSPVHKVLRDSSGDSGSESDNVSASTRSSRSGSPTSQAPIQTTSNARNEHSEDENGTRSPASNISDKSSRSSSQTVESNKLDGSRKSGSPSPTRSGSRHSSIGSESQRSRSVTPKSVASNTSDSQKSPRSQSRSPHESLRSSSPRSPITPTSIQSENRLHERKSKTPASNGSGSESPKSHRSTSPSLISNKSVISHVEKQSNSASAGNVTPLDESVDPVASEKSNAKISKSSPTNDNNDNESNRSFRQTDNDPNSKSDESGEEELSKFKRETGSGTNVVEKNVKRVRAIVNSDSESEIVDKENSIAPTADALFGDASDISTDDEKDKKEERQREHRRSISPSRSRSHSKSRSRSHSRGRSESGEEDLNHRAIIEDEEDKDKEEEPELPPETRIDVEIPKISTDLGREIHFVKLPNFLSVETRPFDHETYEDEIDEEETLDEEGRARLKLKVENTLRWKESFNDEGKIIKESNARFVKWSDGSMSLHLGSEIFDVYKQPLQGDHNHLYIRQGTGLQGQAVFRTKLTFRPHSTESFTHRKMTMSLADRSQKTSGIKVLSQVGMNPDQNRYEMIKKEEEKLRMAMRIQNKTKKNVSSTRNTGRATGGVYSGDTYHDDGSDDESAISLAAIKNKYKKGGALTPTKASHIYSSDEEGSDFETLRPKKNIKGKVLKDSDEESNSESSSISGEDGNNQADNGSD